jgi:hypothetical protein
MTNKVSIFLPEYEGVLTPGAEPPEDNYSYRLVFVRNLPYTESVTVKFRLTPDPSDSGFTVYNAASFEDFEGTATIPQSSSFKVLYVGTDEPVNFLLELIPDPAYTFLVSRGVNNLSSSFKNLNSPILSSLGFEDIEYHPLYSPNVSGDIRVNSISSPSDLSSKGSVLLEGVPSPASDLISVKINPSEFVAIWKESVDSLALQKVSVSTLSPTSDQESYSVSEVIPLLPPNEEFPEISGRFFNLRAAPTNSGKIVLSLACYTPAFGEYLFGSDESFIQIFNPDLTTDGEPIQLTYVPGCDEITSENKNDPNLDTSCIENFQYTWFFNFDAEFPIRDTGNGLYFFGTWYSNPNLTSFPLINTSRGIIFQETWAFCESLTSFPELDLSSGINFQMAWLNNESLTSFPVVNLSSGRYFNQTWAFCESMTSFPLLNLASGIHFDLAWEGCSGLTSFPAINLSSGKNFSGAWKNCTALANFPANMFNNCSSGKFSDSWKNCALTQQSVNNILISLDASGVSNGIVHLNGGTSSAPSALGQTAKDNLILKGWSVFTN